VATSAGGSTAKTSSSGLTFNPSTGTLSSTVMTTLSDKRFKTNINPIVDTAIILQLQGVGFNWIKNGNKSYGLIAQEVEKLLPEAVEEQDGIKTVNYMMITPFLIEMVKAQDEMLMILNERVSKLETRE
jgi:hypothetical protein